MRRKNHLFYFRFQNGPQIRTPRTEKHILARNLGLNTAFLKAFFAVFQDFYLRMRRNTINSTSVSKWTSNSDFSSQKTYVVSNFSPKNVILTIFLLDLRFWQRALGLLAWISGFSPKIRVKIFFYNSNPQKALLCTQRHASTHERSKSGDWVWPVQMSKNYKKNK